MQYLRFVFFFLCFTLGTTALWAQPYKGLPTGKERAASSNEQWEKEVVELVNTIRKRRGLKPLVVHPDLTHAARYHAKDMAVDDYFKHDSHDDEDGYKKRVGSFSERLERFSTTRWFAWAENIALGHTSPRSVVQGWIKSKGHRVNLLNPSYVYIGVGYVDGYWVQTFGG
jgi:uncharacterized protein YkwD